MQNFQFLADRLRQLRDGGRFRELVPRSAEGVHLRSADGGQLINFGGNDYLGLAAERQSVPAPSGSTASALICGWTAQHQALADDLARLESTESAVLFPTGFAACCGTIATLCDEGDLILSDRLNHASLIDGCRLSKAARHVFDHRDHGAVEQILKQRRQQFDRVWIVTDGVFSMDGDVAPLPQLCDLAERYDAILVVDEAHGTGVLGRNGSGLCEELDVKDRVAIRIGTLSKAIGGQGGFVAAPAVVTDYLANRCRPLIYSTALTPAAVASATAAIQTIASQPERRDHLHHLSQWIRRELSIHADPVESKVPIIPLPVGDDAAAVNMSQQLAQRGFFVPAIRPPTVPPGTARLRISLSAAHRQPMVAQLVRAIRELGIA